MEITVGCLTVAYKPKAEEETRKVLKSTIEKYYSTPENKDAVTLMWDHLQASLKCCGVNNYTDYESSTKWKDSGKVIPESCCVLEGDPLKFQPKSPECVTKPSEVNSYYKKVSTYCSSFGMTYYRTTVSGLLQRRYSLAHDPHRHRHRHRRRPRPARAHRHLLSLLPLQSPQRLHQMSPHQKVHLI